MRKTVSNFTFNNKIFVFELQLGEMAQYLKDFNKKTFLSNGRILIKVPYSHLRFEIKKLQLLGVKICDIYPINDQKYQKTIKEIIPLVSVSIPITKTSNSSISQKFISPNIPWWIEILTEIPRCLYYFGPFDTKEEACYYQSGYEEDLKGELAQGITIQIKQCSPTILTQEL